jgi:hypothetical protein
MSTNVLRRYIRRGKTPIGCVVAVKDEDGDIGFGYSLVNKGDHFSKKRAIEIAVGRARTGFYCDPIPEDKYDEVIGELFQMADRATRYFNEYVEFFEQFAPTEEEEFIQSRIDFFEEIEV